MARDSGLPFTVTIGVNGREVRRSSGGSGGRSSGSGSASGKVLGSKRSVKSRLETKGVDSYDDRKHYKKKRHKEESNQASWNKSVSNDARVEKGDLRYTILQKTKSREPQETDQATIVDLRDKLSRKTNISPADSRSHPPETTYDTRKNMLPPRDRYNDKRESMVEHRTYDSEKKNTRGLRDVYLHERQSEPTYDGEKKNTRGLRDVYRHERQSEPTYDGEKKNTRGLRDVYRHERQSEPEFRDAYVDERQSELEFRDAYADERQSIVQDSGNAYNHGRQGMMDPKDSRDWGKQCGLEPRVSYDCGRQDGLDLIPPTRTGSNLTGMDLVRNPPFPWDSEVQRQRSPDMILRSSVPTPFYPERNEDNFQNAMISPYADVNSNLYRRNEIPSSPGAAGPGSFPMHPPSHAISSLPATRPMPSIAQYPQTSGFAHNIPYTVEQQPTVVGFLHSLHLEKYYIPFMAEEVDFNALKQMTDADLKELNIPMGPRKKILQALAMMPQRR